MSPCVELWGSTLQSPCLSLRAQAPLPLNVYKLWPSAWGPHTLHPVPGRPFLGLAGSFSGSAFSRETLHHGVCALRLGVSVVVARSVPTAGPLAVSAPPAWAAQPLSVSPLVLEAASVFLCCILFS